MVPNLLYVCEYIKFYEGPTTNPQAQRQIDLSVEAGRARDPAVSIDITAPFWELGLRELLLLLLRRKPAEKKKKGPESLGAVLSEASATRALQLSLKLDSRLLFFFVMRL